MLLNNIISILDELQSSDVNISNLKDETDDEIVIDVDFKANAISSLTYIIDYLSKYGYESKITRDKYYINPYILEEIRANISYDSYEHLISSHIKHDLQKLQEYIDSIINDPQQFKPLLENALQYIEAVVTINSI